VKKKEFTMEDEDKEVINAQPYRYLSKSFLIMNFCAFVFADRKNRIGQRKEEKARRR
jgi:hypothetical protein